MLTQGLHNKTTLLTPGFTQDHMDYNKKVDHVFPAQGRGIDQLHTATTPSARGLGTGSWALRGGRTSSRTGSWALRGGRASSGTGSWALRGGRARSGTGSWALRGGRVSSGTGSWALRGGRASSGTGSGTRSTRPRWRCSGDVTVDIPRPVAPVGVLVEHGAPWAGFYDGVSVDAPIVDGAVTGVPEPLAFGTTLATRN